MGIQFSNVETWSFRLRQRYRAFRRRDIRRQLKIVNWFRKLQRPIIEWIFGHDQLLLWELENVEDYGNQYYSAGHYGLAQSLFEKALSVRRQLLGDNHPDVAASMDKWADALFAAGDVVAAEPLYQRALQIRQNVLGNTDLNVSASFDNLAKIERFKGDYAASESHCRASITIREKVLGKTHIQTASSLANLADLLAERGDNTEAERLYIRSLPILKGALKYRVTGREVGIRAGLVQRNLALIAAARGNFEVAELRARDALEIMQELLGNEHVHTADALAILAALLQATNKYREAESLHRRALAIRVNSLGRNHFETSRSLADLANVLDKDRFYEALAFYRMSNEIDSKLVGQILATSSERVRMTYTAKMQSALDRFLSFLMQNRDLDATLINDGCTLVLRRKGLVMEVGAQQREALISGKYPALRTIFEKLRETRAILASVTLEQALRSDSDSGDSYVSDLQEQIESIEQNLARSVPEMQSELALRNVDWRSIASVLPTEASLLEFVRFSPAKPNVGALEQRLSSQSDRYLCFVIRPGQVDLRDLGDAATIEALIARFRRAMRGGDSTETRLLDLDEPMVVPEIPESGWIALSNALAERILKPIFDLISGCTQIIVAPDAALALLPFETLAFQDQPTLIDRFQISYLSCARDLLRFATLNTRTTGAPVVIADPDFDLDGYSGGVLLDAVDHEQLEHGRAEFRRLPGTRSEAEAVSVRLSVLPQLGNEATKSKMKFTLAPKVLHLATHGFFFEDQNVKDASRRRLEIDSLSMLRLIENPMLRSGLALAGANRWLRGMPLPPEAENGLLTAEDVTGLDLSGTELVVLSACGTGLGQVHRSEGVFGLRRAFVLAGARTLVMSLWKVADEPTCSLMGQFYANLQNGMGRSKALHQAQLYIRQRYPHPRDWAGFICQGETTPLLLH